VGQWFGDQRADPLQRHRLADGSTFALPHIPVLVALVMSREGAIDEFNFGQPLHRRDRVPAWNDETQWISMFNRQGLAVHRVGEQHIAVAGVIDPQAALKANGFRQAVDGTAIGAAKQHVLRILPHAGAVQDLDKRHTGPLRRADGAEAPFLPIGRPIEQRASVAGALERDHLRLRSHVLKIANRETLWPLDEASDRQPE